MPLTDSLNIYPCKIACFCMCACVYLYSNTARPMQKYMNKNGAILKLIPHFVCINIDIIQIKDKLHYIENFVPFSYCFKRRGSLLNREFECNAIQ